MKYIYTTLLLLAFTITSFSQKSNDDRDHRREKMENRIESQKIAFITQELDLTPEEAQRFWPIYNEFQAKMKDFRNQSKIDVRSEDISESEADVFLDNLLSQEKTELDLKKNYFTKLKSVIPSKKVARLYIIEKKFREKVIAKIKNKMGKRKRKERMGN